MQVSSHAKANIFVIHTPDDTTASKTSFLAALCSESIVVGLLLYFFVIQTNLTIIKSNCAKREKNGNTIDVTKQI